MGVCGSQLQPGAVTVRTVVACRGCYATMPGTVVIILCVCVSLLSLNLTLPVQLLACEGGLPEPATKSDGLFSSVVVVRDGVLQSDTGESRLAPPPPRPLAPYDAAEQQQQLSSTGQVRAGRGSRSSGRVGNSVVRNHAMLCVAVLQLEHLK